MGRQTENPRMLIVEMSSHYTVVEQLYFLFSETYKTTVLIRRIHTSRSPLSKFLGPQTLRNTLSTPTKRNLLLTLLAFYGRLYVLGWKSERIILSTGPEGLNSLETFLFPYVIWPWRGKVVLIIRTPALYIPQDKSKSKPRNFGQKARFALAANVGSWAFESRTQMQFFLEAINSYSSNPKYRKPCSVIYTRFSDYLRFHTRDEEEAIPKSSDSVRLGLLGAIDCTRRDYEVLSRALSLLEPSEQTKIEIVILGTRATCDAAEVLSSLRRYTKVVEGGETLTEREFQLSGISCDVLISPLSVNQSYGFGKGTGSIGDAIFLRKALVIPASADPASEFSDIALYYSDSADLATLIKSLASHEAPIPAGNNYRQYSSGEVRKRVLDQFQHMGRFGID